jgi:phosphatidylglycerophosphatase A
MLKLIEHYRQKSQPVPNAVWHSPLYFIAFGFGSGAFPVAPGTAGTVVAAIFYLGLRYLPLGEYLLFTLIFSIVSIWLLDQLSREIQVHDHPGMCLDEFAGYFVTMINAPWGFSWMLLGFILFRLFDIWKPWPISWLDKHIHGGFGMVIDDIAAGALAMIVMQIIHYFV